ncbi:MAG: hypothetical protein AAGF04_01520 [Chlamydiota bacterium]
MEYCVDCLVESLFNLISSFFAGYQCPAICLYITVSAESFLFLNSIFLERFPSGPKWFSVVGIADTSGLALQLLQLEHDWIGTLEKTFLIEKIALGKFLLFGLSIRAITRFWIYQVFVGRGNPEQFLQILFCNVLLHCFLMSFAMTKKTQENQIQEFKARLQCKSRLGKTLGASLHSLSLFQASCSRLYYLREIAQSTLSRWGAICEEWCDEVIFKEKCRFSHSPSNRTYEVLALLQEGTFHLYPALLQDQKTDHNKHG